jgi:hypothetical protein
MYSIELHILHLRSTRYSRSAAASATASLRLVWAACTQEAPSTPNRTPPLAIYVRFFTLFFF